MDGQTNAPATAPTPRRAKWYALLAFAATATLSLIIPAEKMKLRNADLTVPLAYGHDSFLIQCWVKTLADTGWWITTDRCGAPYGHQMYDFPTNPSIHIALMRGMLPFTHDPAILINAYFILCFPLIGLTAHAALRSMRFAHLYCILGGVLYACQPYHFWRGESHLFLAAYFLLPLVTMVMVWLHRGEELFLRRGENGRWKIALGNRRSLAALAIVAAEGFDFPYFSVFAGVFLAVAGATAFALHRQGVILVRTAGLLAVLGAAFLTSLSPNLLYFHQYGTNPSETHVTHHPWSDGEEYALKPIQLLLPAPNHPIPALEKIRAKYYAGTKLPSEADSMAMGSAASLGFLALLACVPFCSRSRTDRGRLFHLLGVLLVAGIVFCTAGGVGTAFNLLSLTVVRCYCRASVFLAFFCMAGFCGMLDALFQRYFAGSVIRTALCVPVAIGLLYLGCRDQMGMVYLQEFSEVREEYRNDEDFVRRIEDTMPPDAMVFQYPYIAYGSYTNVAGGMLPYSHFRGYVHSHSVRWSFGAMHGRPGDDLHAKIALIPTDEQQLRALAILGFEGIYVDRLGYADRGKKLEDLLKAVATPDPIESRDGRLAFYTLQGYRKTALAGLSDGEVARRKREIEDFPSISWSAKFYPEERGDLDGWRRWRWCGSDGALVLKNPSAEPQKLRIRMSLRPQSGGAKLQLTGPEIDEAYELPHAGVDVDRVFELPPGTHRIEFRCQGLALTHPDRPFPLYFMLHDFTLERPGESPR